MYNMNGKITEPFESKVVEICLSVTKFTMG